MHQIRWARTLATTIGMLAGMELTNTPIIIAPPASCALVQKQLPSQSLITVNLLPNVINHCATGGDLIFYGDSYPSNILLQPYEILSAELETTNAGEKNTFILFGDTNRDGILDTKDYFKRHYWNWKKGAIILFNNDDDDGNKSLDWQDKLINGDKDIEDLAKLKFKVGSNFAKAKLVLEADEKASPYINIFQKDEGGWKLVNADGKSALAYNRDILFGVEAKQFANKDWNGLLRLKALAIQDGKIVAEDTIKMRVSPWIMLPNTAPVVEMYVSDRGKNNSQFISQIRAIASSINTTVQVVPGGNTWMQDTMKIGYVQFPNQSRLQNFSVVLESHLKSNARSLLNNDFGWFEISKPRQLDVFNQWIDGYGNLQVTPPLPGFPLGRIYYGKAGSVSFHPEVLDFIKAQEIQGTPVEIDTSWLMIRHVDEVINFISTPSGTPLMLVVSPEAGVNLLKELFYKGYGKAKINRELKEQTTVEAALNNKNLIEYNLKLQRENVNPIIVKLKKEFNLKDEQIIPIPAMFGYGGYSWWPNMVNSVEVNGHLLVSDPRGAIINGKDYTQEAFRERIAPSKLKVHFLDARYYHELRGNTHSAINTRRQATEKPFWKLLPPTLKKP
ncbi:MAG: protein-arginine deiminase domain-containing protein [Oscillatoriaceae bacterium SKW80]|nr:protein-arginine deiminase domain-containing protein [Oscillatoriaceae bacterium SKYG93]MCX8121572.1 protein-arginine deiminase domain-containing protein [Oscillatoriaceae bacterium SKW80]MDW8452841.1 protein-arginine deiminase family protein [Oscillatoriaceae cyanobacterium SKYGB_i_bin93]HIK27917.1 protein-arginine deiminase [Oscillatoriaceae cyanobacterium M7585_C2015_266]